jgi:hypothetical protein
VIHIPEGIIGAGHVRPGPFLSSFQTPDKQKPKDRGRIPGREVMAVRIITLGAASVLAIMIGLGDGYLLGGLQGRNWTVSTRSTN